MKMSFPATKLNSMNASTTTTTAGALSLADRVAIAGNLSWAGWEIRTGAAAAAEAIAAEEKRHHEAMSAIADVFEIEVWRAVRANWSADEIIAALPKPAKS